MIHLFPASFVRQSNGKIGSRTLTFEVDDLHRDLSKEIGNSIVGTQFLIVAYEIGENMKEITDAHTDKKSTRNLLMKQLHAKIGEYAAMSGVSDVKIKNALRAKLISKGLIIESTSELEEDGLAKAVFYLTTELHPNRTNYD